MMAPILKKAIARRKRVLLSLIESLIIATETRSGAIEIETLWFQNDSYKCGWNIACEWYENLVADKLFRVCGTLGYIPETLIEFDYYIKVTIQWNYGFPAWLPVTTSYLVADLTEPEVWILGYRTVWDEAKKLKVVPT